MEAAMAAVQPSARVTTRLPQKERTEEPGSIRVPYNGSPKTVAR